MQSDIVGCVCIRLQGFRVDLIEFRDPVFSASRRVHELDVVEGQTKYAKVHMLYQKELAIEHCNGEDVLTRWDTCVLI